MRIITGTAKGIRLKAPRGLDVRPTGDRVKESMFNILANLKASTNSEVIYGARVLDLFAGTGNLGLEALSRGAHYALFVDRSQVSLAVIKDNIHSARLNALAEVRRGDSLKTLDSLAEAAQTFRLIFIDPPYNEGLVNAALLKLDMTSIVEPGGVIVVEHSKHEPVNTDWKYLQSIRTEHYGETFVTFLMR
ncbi:Ribosomal RNA small subunit methyltransferase D [Sporomusa aerivorans]